jgi:hypothetical protein
MAAGKDNSLSLYLLVGPPVITQLLFNLQVSKNDSPNSNVLVESKPIFQLGGMSSSFLSPTAHIIASAVPEVKSNTNKPLSTNQSIALAICVATCHLGYFHQYQPFFLIVLPDATMCSYISFVQEV